MTGPDAPDAVLALARTADDPNGALLIDAGGRIVELNETAAALLGRSAARCRGRRLLALLPPAAMEAVRLALPQFFATGRLRDLELTIDEGGETTLLLVDGLALRNEDGAFSGARLSVRDATRREARRAHEGEVALRAALARFAAAVAHKINNPLQGLVVRLELLEEDCAEGGADPDLVEKIAEGVARIQSVVADLPTLQRRHEPAPEEARAPLHKVLAEALALVQDPAAHRRVALVLDAPDELPPSSVPASVVRDILAALLLNAARAARPGGEVELTVLADGDGGTLVVVHDDAPAIDEGRLGHVFDPFTGCEAGRGDDCGLFVAFLLARRHGARLAVSSCPGRGNTFKLLLPSA